MSGYIATMTGNRRVVMAHNQRVWQELRALGVSKFGLHKLSCRYLPYMIHPNEHLQAVVYGRYQKGKGLLVATDRRVLFLDKKLFFVNSNELTYEIVGGVSFDQDGLWGTITLHTKMGDFLMRTMNIGCAERFRDYIESRCLNFNQDQYLRSRF